MKATVYACMQGVGVLSEISISSGLGWIATDIDASWLYRAFAMTLHTSLYAVWPLKTSELYNYKSMHMLATYS